MKLLIFIFSLSLIVCSCSVKQEKSVETKITDNDVLSSETILINDVSYKKETITGYYQSYDVVWLYNSVRLTHGKDTIEFMIDDDSYVYDSIYDINHDGKKDLIVKSNMLRKDVRLLSYLFDKQMNRLATIPDTLINFIPSDKNGFFQVFYKSDDYLYHFERYKWTKSGFVHEKTYYITNSYALRFLEKDTLPEHKVSERNLTVE